MPYLKKKSLEVYLCSVKLYKMHLGSRRGIIYTHNNTSYNVALEVHFSLYYSNNEMESEPQCRDAAEDDFSIQ